MTQDVVVQCTLTDVDGDKKIWIDGCCADDGKGVPISDSLSGDCETDNVCVECFATAKFNDRDGSEIDPVSTTYISGNHWRDLEDGGHLAEHLTGLMVDAELAVRTQRYKAASAP